MKSPTPDCVLVRPGELSLKGGNRRRFEKILRRNLRLALEHALGEAPRIEKRHGRFYLLDPRDPRKTARLAARVFGVANASPASRVPAEPAALEQAALKLLERRLEEAAPRTFAVRVRRADKRFPIRSGPFAAEVGARVLEAHPGLKVDLDAPELELGIEIREEGAFVFLEKIPGSGGLPVGSEGRVLSLLSGGIDSPVASWMMMKRGCRVEFLHFDSSPFTGPGSLEKVRRLARILDSWQGGTKVFVCPFAEIQKVLRARRGESYRTLLYRRFMMRIAGALASRRRLGALVTGDSLGQVASQTLANLRVVHAAAADLPVFRPLVGLDKEETIALARRIGTYETSIEPYEDCCTLFQPRSPATAGKAETAAALEAGLDLEGLTAGALENLRELDLDAPPGPGGSPGGGPAR